MIRARAWLIGVRILIRFSFIVDVKLRLKSNLKDAIARAVLLDDLLAALFTDPTVATIMG